VGTASTFVVTLYDAYGNVASRYVGTIHFASDDTTALLPADYTFTLADTGTHTFSATFKKAVTHYLKATDPSNSSLSGSQTGIVVN
jgi:adhesin/invasin